MSNLLSSIIHCNIVIIPHLPANKMSCVREGWKVR